MGNLCVGRRKTKVLKWKIKGFSSLAKFGDKNFSSSSLMAGGLRWTLVVNPMFPDDSGESFVAFCLCVYSCYLPSDAVIKVVYKLFFYNQLYPIQSKAEEMCDFLCMSKLYGRKSILIPLETFYDQNSGFLVNDSCVFGIEFEDITQMLDPKDVFECWSIQEEIDPRVYTWKIESFSKLKRPCSVSEHFAIGGLDWVVCLYPDGRKNKNYLAAWLSLKNPSTLPLKLTVCVDFSICVLDQINGKHKKLTDQQIFCSASSSHGWNKFLPLKDLNDSSKGFLVNNVCIVEATIAILGSANTLP